MAVRYDSQVIYTVKPGDTVYSIATRFGSSVALIQNANAIYPPFTDPFLIYPGWLLIVPIPTTQPLRSTYIVTRGDSLYAISQRFSAYVDLLVGMNPQVEDANQIFIDQALWVPAYQYEVMPGDTLTRIAAKLGVPIEVIIKANEGRPAFSLDVIYPSYRLILPLPSTRNIVVTRPLPSEAIRTGYRVEGFARVFEANVLMKVQDDQNNIIVKERFTTASEGAPAYGHFSEPLPFERNPATQGGELLVYARSPKDGSIIDLVRVKVRFA